MVSQLSGPFGVKSTVLQFEMRILTEIVMSMAQTLRFLLPTTGEQTAAEIVKVISISTAMWTAAILPCLPQILAGLIVLNESKFDDD